MQTASADLSANPSKSLCKFFGPRASKNHFLNTCISCRTHLELVGPWQILFIHWINVDWSWWIIHVWAWEPIQSGKWQGCIFNEHRSANLPTFRLKSSIKLRSYSICSFAAFEFANVLDSSLNLDQVNRAPWHTNFTSKNGLNFFVFVIVARKKRDTFLHRHLWLSRSKKRETQKYGYSRIANTLK